MTTAVGTGVCGYDDGVVGASRLHWPQGLAAAVKLGVTEQTLYFVEGKADTIRQLLVNQGTVSTLSGNPAMCTADCGCADPAGGYGEGISSQAKWNSPFDIAYDAKSGSLFVSDGDNHVIRRIQ